MKAWRWILLLVLVAVAAAFAWHWVALDPGRVLIDIRGWQVQTTLVTAVVIVVVVVLLLIWGWRAVRWPFGAVSRRHRRTCRRQLLAGLTALAEGRHGAAGRALAKAAAYAPQRGVAWLAAAQAAAAGGDGAALREALDKAARELPQAARIARARWLRKAGKPTEAVALLAVPAAGDKLAPAGQRELLLAALAAGDARRALQTLAPVHKSGVLAPAREAELEQRTVAAAIGATTNGAELKQLWSDLPRAQRRRPQAIAAYAGQALRFGQSMAAMHEVESALRRQWSAPLVQVWGSLDGEDLEARLRRAEGWLSAHADDATLLATLGHMCVRLAVWGKAREYLTRALALEPSVAAWESLGDVYAGQDNVLLSQRCYHNALRLTRAEATEPLPGGHAVAAATASITRTDRDDNGLPRMPAY